MRDIEVYIQTRPMYVCVYKFAITDVLAVQFEWEI